MKSRSLAVLAALLLAQDVPGLAADGLPGATVRADSGKSPAERKARAEEWCKANPEKCKEAQAKREQCKADPEKCRAEAQARTQERFKIADANGDGRLSREEAQKGMSAVARNFDRFDANKDGAVTVQELEAARKAREAARKGPSSSLRGSTLV